MIKCFLIYIITWKIIKDYILITFSKHQQIMKNQASKKLDVGSQRGPQMEQNASQKSKKIKPKSGETHVEIWNVEAKSGEHQTQIRRKSGENQASGFPTAGACLVAGLGGADRRAYLECRNTMRVSCSLVFVCVRLWLCVPLYSPRACSRTAALQPACQQTNTN